MRQIILDTETTGLRAEEGHRIIEIGCLEMINRRLTGMQFHYYINPEREIDAGATAVHGITNAKLYDKPKFAEIARELMDFLQNDELIIHNAPFDLSFLNAELVLTRQGWKQVHEYCNIIDTLQMARKLHVGQRNSLDALCKRYSIDNTKRELHGALLDANLLAQVYLAMTGGQGSFFDTATTSTSSGKHEEVQFTKIEADNLVVLHATEEESAEHQKYLDAMRKKGKCVWKGG